MSQQTTHSNDPNAALRERIAVLEREKYDLTLRVIEARERVAKQRNDIAGVERRIDVVKYALNRL
jgi:hypothetical protein